MMSLKEFIEAATQYIIKMIAERFNGKVVITLNFNSGGIGNVQVSTTHNLEKIKD
jgi:hypothetical protein